MAVVGAGWAGLAAAVRLRQQGACVTVLEMAAVPGGRARTLPCSASRGAAWLDNGQHILIGAYTRTLALMDTVGSDAATRLHRQPLALVYPDGSGLRMLPGPAWLVFGLGVLGIQGWGWRDKQALLGAAWAWLRAGFRCEASLTVAQLCAHLPAAVRNTLIDPLCVAALNTPANQASAAVFLRVLRDALFSGSGAADLLLPRVPLSQLLPEPAWQWLASQGCTLHTNRRVRVIEPDATRPTPPRWRIDGELFDQVVLACSATEAARLTAPVAPSWARRAAAFAYEPIVTVVTVTERARLPWPMLALREGPQAPAQFVFDHGALGGPPGQMAWVVSGAAAWVERGLDATAQAVLAQAHEAFAGSPWLSGLKVLSTLSEKRATFRCVPGLDRPESDIAPGLVAAGDYLAGPYPATLEGAVRSGEAAAVLLEP